MHQYLNAIGFGNINSKKELNALLSGVEHSFSQHNLVTMEPQVDFCEYQKIYGDRIGIALYGDMDIDENFHQKYYFPYLKGTGITSYADVYIERRIDREAYVGICEDIKIEISLIFSLQNVVEYMKEKELAGRKIQYSSVTLSGLCNKGTILLPVLKSKEQTKRQREMSLNRMMLQSAAKTGDPNAIESLTLDDIDTYSMVSKRIVTEDLFSIVDTYIMPYGIECDRYSILGEILELDVIKNEYSNEAVYVMKLEVNELTFDVCVPAKDVTGEPAVGRRFKGDIWMQGRINF
jgi:hypothetical protein